MEARQTAEAEFNPKFWLYVVDSVKQGDPTRSGLRMLGGAQLARLLANKRVVTYCTLPFTAAEYDAAPRRSVGF